MVACLAVISPSRRYFCGQLALSPLCIQNTSILRSPFAQSLGACAAVPFISVWEAMPVD
jgi:hypothetical protein